MPDVELCNCEVTSGRRKLRSRAIDLNQSISFPNEPIAFGPFRLLPAQQLLMEGDKSVRLGSRALEILLALVERDGALVAKEELFERVWPNTFVDESNLASSARPKSGVRSRRHPLPWITSAAAGRRRPAVE
jgi:DNA-binding response OmpR family regulator